MSIKINVTHTAYEGSDFPEAEHYGKYVEAALAGRYQGLGQDVEISVEEGPRTKVHVRGVLNSDQERQMVEDIENAVKADLWEAFCANGYKQYTAAAR